MDSSGVPSDMEQGSCSILMSATPCSLTRITGAPGVKNFSGQMRQTHHLIMFQNGKLCPKPGYQIAPRIGPQPMPYPSSFGRHETPPFALWCSLVSTKVPCIGVIGKLACQAIEFHDKRLIPFR